MRFMSTAKQIFEQLGNVAAVAAELNVPYTTVHSWGRHNNIPPWRWPDVLALAAKKGVAVASDKRPNDPRPNTQVAA